MLGIGVQEENLTPEMGKVGDGQAGPVVALLDETGEYDEVEVRSDLARKERIVMAKRAA